MGVIPGMTWVRNVYYARKRIHVACALQTTLSTYGYLSVEEYLTHTLHGGVS
jgi:hypothetical protein